MGTIHEFRKRPEDRTIMDKYYNEMSGDEKRAAMEILRLICNVAIVIGTVSFAFALALLIMIITGK